MVPCGVTTRFTILYNQVGYCIKAAGEAHFFCKWLFFFLDRLRVIQLITIYLFIYLFFIFLGSSPTLNADSSNGGLVSLFSGVTPKGFFLACDIESYFYSAASSVMLAEY